nr:interferon lambda-2 [Peromyscus maniculatus bairdii]
MWWEGTSWCAAEDSKNSPTQRTGVGLTGTGSWRQPKCPSLGEWEELLLQKDVRCSTNPFPSSWKLGQLQVQERPRALQAELALTLKVLENMTDSALVPILDQPLHTLRHIHSQLQACTQPQPTAEPRPVSRRLSRWLHRLQEAQRKETPGCLEDSVTSNLFRLLIRDLKCVASGDQCA